MVKVIAHAGCENTKEGTWESYVAAIEHGADLIEVDLRWFHNKILISHDPIDPAREMDYLRLATLLNLVEDTNIGLNLDIKELAVLEHLKVILAEKKPSNPIFLTGEFAYGQFLAQDTPHFFVNAEHVVKISDSQPLSPVETQSLIDSFRDLVRFKGLRGYNICSRILTKEALEAFRAADIKLCCWTVDNKDELEFLLNHGVYAITTNRVSMARALAVAQTEGKNQPR